MIDLTPQQKAAITKAKNKENKEVLEEAEKIQVKSFSIVRKKDGWYFVEHIIENDQVVKKHEVGPTMRAIIIEEFKVTAQRHIENME